MITQKLNLDLQLSQRQPVLYAKQGDALLRAVELHLFEGGRTWSVPNDLTIRQVVFCKADGHGGAYDTMPDGSTAAVAINGNVATVTIVPEVLTCAGRCAMELQLMSEDGEQITTWTWIYQVAESVERRIQSTDYWNVQSIAQMRTAIEAIQEILATHSQDIEALKSKNHLGVFIGNVPDSGEAVSASRAQLKPTANIGDFVVGQNGKIGRVQEGTDALHLEVAGLGWAISGWTDVSVDYAAAHTETPTLTPRTYLLNLPAGRYRLADGDTMLYLAEVDAVDEAERCRISAMDHDGDTTYETYINAVLVAAYTETAAGSTFTKPVQVPTPQAGSDAANKQYVDTKGGLTATAKQALLNCFAHVAWTDEHGQDYYDALEAALYPPANLVSISAVFEQGQTVVYNTDSLDVLKPMLTVTAHYSDATMETVTTYTLSGTLTEGTSTITVSYGGKTTTFNVTVTVTDVLYSLFDETFDSESHYINTGVKLLETNRAFTIALDCTSASRQLSDKQWHIIDCLGSDSPWPGICLQRKSASDSTNGQFVWTTQKTDMPISSSSPVHLRLVATHSAGSASLLVQYKIGNNDTASFTLSGTFSAVNNPFYVGSKWLGTINKLIIYSDVISNDKISDFIGG